jgi:hypothetical protein
VRPIGQLRPLACRTPRSIREGHPAYDHQSLHSRGSDHHSRSQRHIRRKLCQSRHHLRDGGSWLLPRAVGFSRAAEMSFTGEPIDVSTALARGLVSRVVTRCQPPCGGGDAHGEDRC